MSTAASNPAADFVLPGQENLSGSSRALHLKQYAGQVMKNFMTANIADRLIRQKTISSGSSFQFPMLGSGFAEYLARGDEMTGQSIEVGAKTIEVDGLLTYSKYFFNLDEMMMHFDTRSPIADDAGYKLAATKDRNVLSMLYASAVAGDANAVKDRNGDTVTAQNVTIANDTVNEFVDAVFGARQYFDEKGIPVSDMTMVISPETRWALQTVNMLVNSDFTEGNSFGEGRIAALGGLGFVVSPHLALNHADAGVLAKYPDSVDEAGTATSKYAADARLCAGLIVAKDAAATVTLQNVKTETEYSVARQSTLLASTVSCGHGILRPELIYSISKTATGALAKNAIS